MVTTYAELLNRLLGDYLLRPDLNAEGRRALDNAIKTFEAQRFWFNEAITTLTAVASQTYLTIPSDFLKLDELKITIASADTALVQQAASDLRLMAAVRTTGEPTDFAYYADRFELFPTPDSAYTFPCYYLKTLGSLSDGSTTAWTNEAGNLIVHTAAMDLYFNVLRNSDDGQRHAAAASIARTELDMRNVRVTRGKLRPTRF